MKIINSTGRSVGLELDFKIIKKKRKKSNTNKLIEFQVSLMKSKD